MAIKGVIVLFRCQSPETAERLMQYLNTTYQLTLVREDDGGNTGKNESDLRQSGQDTL